MLGFMTDWIFRSLVGVPDSDGRMCMAEQTVHLMARKQKKKKRLGPHSTTPFIGTPPMT
jgi:hypothetical protein